MRKILTLLSTIAITITPATLLVSCLKENKEFKYNIGEMEAKENIPTEEEIIHELVKINTHWNLEKEHIKTIEGSITEVSAKIEITNKSSKKYFKGQIEITFTIKKLIFICLY